MGMGIQRHALADFPAVKAPVTIIKDLGEPLSWSGKDMAKRKFLVPTEDRTPTYSASTLFQSHLVIII
jgi:hypothetical protein